jgi:hypothetical protein
VAAVFITQQMLTAWSDQGKVRLEDVTLHLLQENRTVKLKPAVRFVKLIDEGVDPNKLIGKVKTKEQLTELKAEHYMDSVILGDVGYTVVEGFLGDLSPPPPGDKTDVKKKPISSSAPAPVALEPAPQTVPPPTVAPSDKKGELEKEAEELSKLFLTTVRD